MSAKKTEEEPAGSTATKRRFNPFTAEERAAMKERAKELREAERKEGGERAALAKIAEMPRPDRTMAERLQGRPTLSPAERAAL